MRCVKQWSFFSLEENLYSMPGGELTIVSGDFHGLVILLTVRSGVDCKRIELEKTQDIA